MKPVEISSPENAVFRALHGCLTTKGIKKHKMFMASGARVTRELASQAPNLVRNFILCNGKHQSELDIEPGARGENFSLLSLTSDLFQQLDIFGTRQPILVMTTPELPQAALASPPVGLELYCALGDPANVGALLRSAAAFQVGKVILLSESASPFHPRAVRAASATTLLTPLALGPSIHDVLTNDPHPLLALDLNGQALEAFVWPRNCRLMVGEEGMGIPPHFQLTRLSIPIAASVESLNATIAASIALHGYRCTQDERR